MLAGKTVRNHTHPGKLFLREIRIFRFAKRKIGIPFQQAAARADYECGESAKPRCTFNSAQKAKAAEHFLTPNLTSYLLPPTSYLFSDLSEQHFHLYCIMKHGGSQSPDAAMPSLPLFSDFAALCRFGHSA
jgi:hypothetical protein